MRRDGGEDVYEISCKNDTAADFISVSDYFDHAADCNYYFL
jgi:hypothetical protein